MKYKDEEVAFGDLLLSQTYTLQALINVLERKGLLTKQEILDELKLLEDDAVGEYQVKDRDDMI